jgi:hypothetical protein
LSDGPVCDAMGNATLRELNGKKVNRRNALGGSGARRAGSGSRVTYPEQ